MGIDSQAVLLDIPEQPAVEQRAVTAKAKLRTVNRNQTRMVTVHIETLIPQDHKARAIWKLTGEMDLSRFEAPLKTREGAAGLGPASAGELMDIRLQ